MSVSVKSLGLDKLATAEKVALIDELWAGVVADGRDHPVSAQLAAALDRRLAAHEANPSDVCTLEEVMETLKRDREE